jgi:hypothetical protein
MLQSSVAGNDLDPPLSELKRLLHVLVPDMDDEAEQELKKNIARTVKLADELSKEEERFLLMVSRSNETPNRGKKQSKSEKHVVGLCLLPGLLAIGDEGDVRVLKKPQIFDHAASR